MACELGAAGANEPAGLGRHAPLPINATARVPEPPLWPPSPPASIAGLAAPNRGFCARLLRAETGVP